MMRSTACRAASFAAAAALCGAGWLAAAPSALADESAPAAAVAQQSATVHAGTVHTTTVHSGTVHTGTVQAGSVAAGAVGAGSATAAQSAGVKAVAQDPSVKSYDHEPWYSERHHRHHGLLSGLLDAAGDLLEDLL